MKRVYAALLILILVLAGCASKTGHDSAPSKKQVAVNSEGVTLEQRFSVPAGYERSPAPKGSFGEFLRSLPLKPQGTQVKYYDGRIKNRDVYEAVIDLDVGSRDLQQCADAVIRLRAEYLYKEERYGDISFNFTSGFTAEYSKWRDGYRVKVEGNSARWVKTAAYSLEYKEFRKYLDTVFAYAGTLSLAKEMSPVKIEDMEIGDVFIQGGSPGHCVIVVDMAYDPKTGEQLFMLAQSYMPAQDIHILKNNNDPGLSPWYSLGFENELTTPEWSFNKGDLKGF